jgi:glucose-6-phosphate isomerase
VTALEKHIVFEASFAHEPLGPGVLDLFLEWKAAGRLGFMSLPGNRELLQQSLDLAASVADEVTTAVVDGIGGSALGLRALISACRPRGGRNLIVVDSPDPATLESVRRCADPSSTLLIVVTKSGSTAETMGVFLDLWKWFREAGVKPRIVAITDPEDGDLGRLAKDMGWPTLPVPRDVGGRYSVMSPVGIFPAALAGIDVEKFLGGAGEVLEDFEKEGLGSLSARMAACFLSRLGSHPIHVFFTYCDALFDTGMWFSQLWAESLGKNTDLSGRKVCVGQTPLACRGPADQHSLVQLFMEGPADKFVTVVTVEQSAAPLPGGFEKYPALAWLEGRTLQELRNAEARASSMALTERGLPVASLSLKGPPGEASAGMLMMSLEIATVLTGLALGINPLDQPGVERGKHLTFREMGRAGYR